MSRKLFPTSTDCEIAFYDAFERADLKLMMAVWADEPDIVCIHPQGPRLAGLSAVRESFTEIFSGGPSVTLQITELRKHSGQTLAIHCVYESFTMRNQRNDPNNPNKPPQNPPILATNVYQLTPNGWRMIVHHASLAPQGTVAEEQGVARILH